MAQAGTSAVRRSAAGKERGNAVVGCRTHLEVVYAVDTLGPQVVRGKKLEWI